MPSLTTESTALALAVVAVVLFARTLRRWVPFPSTDNHWRGRCFCPGAGVLPSPLSLPRSLGSAPPSGSHGHTYQGACLVAQGHKGNHRLTWQLAETIPLFLPALKAYKELTFAHPQLSLPDRSSPEKGTRAYSGIQRADHS